MPSAASSPPLIKRYLPVRLTVPSLDGKGTDDTFFFVTEHRTAAQNDAKAAKLFVANCPVVPRVQTKLLLRSLFGRYGKVARVTVMESTRSEETLESTAQTPEPSFFEHTLSEGKFAHAVFDSKNDMKKAMRALREIMMGNDTLPGLRLEEHEVETLATETERQLLQNREEEVDEQDLDQKSTGIAAVAERWRTSHRALSRSALLEECNSIMESFEQAEDDDRRSREAASQEPDEDGFVTVSYTKQSAESKRELEEGGRRKATKRNRNRKKEGIGATELPDFYRFQMKQSRMKNLQELRKRFEEDLAKVKKVQENRQCKPF